MGCNNKFNQKGITLVSLVITIIILIILASIVVHLALGENGILRKTQEAKDKYKISSYHDLIEIDKGTAGMEKLGALTIDDIADEISRDTQIPIADLYVEDEQTAILITEEGYKFEIKLDSTKYIEQVDIKGITKGIYAVLNGNTLKFFSSKENAQAEGGKLYDENIREKVFTRTGTWPNKRPDTPWYDDRESIQVVSFEDAIAPINMDSYFEGLTKLTTINKIENLKTYNVTSMNFMLASCTSLTNIDNFLTKINTRNVTSMNSMFYNCTSLTSVNLSKFNTSKVTDMNSMFSTCSKLTNLNLSNFDTSNVTNMGYMFQSCEKLTSLDIKSFNTSKVTDMNNMFNTCKALNTLDVSNFDTSMVTGMNSMFNSCVSLNTLDLSNFNTTNVTNMDYMFAWTSNLTELNLSNFTTKAETNIKDIFKSCSKLKTIYASIEKWQRGNLTAEGIYNDCQAKYLETTNGDIFKIKMDKGFGWWTTGGDLTTPVTGWSNENYMKNNNYIPLDTNKKYKLEMPGDKYEFRVYKLDENKLQLSVNSERIIPSQNDIILENAIYTVFDALRSRRR